MLAITFFMSVRQRLGVFDIFWVHLRRCWALLRKRLISSTKESRATERVLAPDFSTVNAAIAPNVSSTHG